MKNVAATRGHSVSLAMPFLGLGRAWALRSAGSDNVLNFSLSPSSATPPLKSDAAWPAFRRIHFSLRHAREKASSDENFFALEGPPRSRFRASSPSPKKPGADP